MLNALRNINNMEWMETHPVIFGRICIGSFVTGAGIAAIISIISIIRYKRKKTKKN